MLQIMLTPIELWGRWIPEATEQNLLKFIVCLYHEVMSTFSILGDKILFLETRFFQENVFISHALFETQTESEINTDKFKKKNVLNESFAHNLTRYHTQFTTFF